MALTNSVWAPDVVGNVATTVPLPLRVETVGGFTAPVSVTVRAPLWSVPPAFVTVT